jgi:hypothetical protein
MAEDHVNLGDWQTRMPTLKPPSVHWQAGRAGAIFLSAAAFLVISFLVPLRFVAMSAGNPLNVEGATEKLEEQIETLAKEELIEQDRAESMEEKIEQLRAEASGEDPAKTWEALDHLQQAVAKAAEEAAEKMAADSENLAMSEALSTALAEDGATMDSKLMTEAMKELAEMTEAANAANQLADAGISDRTLEALKAGSLSKEQLKELAEALRKANGKLAKQLGELRKAELIDLATMKKCEGAGKCDSDGLCAFLSENGDNMSVAELLKLWSQPGKGGVSRGRGDAPMTWKDASSEQGAKFKEQVLSPSSLASLKDSELVGQSVSAPTTQKNTAAQSGALAGTRSGGGAAFTQRVLPRHKGAVKRYFERP